MDIFYIDESNDAHTYVVTAVAVPFLRQVGGIWTIVWKSRLESAKAWRKKIRDDLDIPMSKELHGTKLVSGRGNYLKGKYNFHKPKAGAVYRQILSFVDFLPDESIITVSFKKGGKPLYGKSQLEGALYGLFQRMRRQCEARQTNALVFFDAGHPEYRRLYRQAQVWLPTGSAQGNWGGSSGIRNLPLDMFTKDGNEKDSKHCQFTQLADLIAFSAFLKLKNERQGLEPWQAACSLENLYDSLPVKLINRKATNRYADGIVRLD
jgi:hypothetical protein